MLSPQHQKNLVDLVGAERDYRYFFTLSGREKLSNYQKTFRNLTKGLTYVWGQWPIHFSQAPFFSNCMF